MTVEILTRSLLRINQNSKNTWLISTKDINVFVLLPIQLVANSLWKQYKISLSPNVHIIFIFVLLLLPKMKSLTGSPLLRFQPPFITVPSQSSSSNKKKERKKTKIGNWTMCVWFHCFIVRWKRYCVKSSTSHCLGRWFTRVHKLTFCFCCDS